MEKGYDLKSLINELSSEEAKYKAISLLVGKVDLPKDQIKKAIKFYTQHGYLLNALDLSIKIGNEDLSEEICERLYKKYEQLDEKINNYRVSEGRIALEYWICELKVKTAYQNAKWWEHQVQLYKNKQDTNHQKTTGESIKYAKTRAAEEYEKIGLLGKAAKLWEDLGKSEKAKKLKKLEELIKTK